MLVLTGVVLLIAAAWWLHPAAGLAASGSACLALAIALVRNADASEGAE